MKKWNNLYKNRKRPKSCKNDNKDLRIKNLLSNKQMKMKADLLLNLFSKTKDSWKNVRKSKETVGSSLERNIRRKKPSIEPEAVIL